MKVEVPAWLKTTLHFLGAALMLYVFIIIVMTAIAQQDVLARMAKDKVELGYSSAFAMENDIDQRRKPLEALREQQQQVTAALPRLNSDVLESQGRFDSDWASFEPAAKRLASACALALDQASSNSGRLAAWRDANDCRSNASLPTSSRRLLESALAGGDLERDARMLADANLAYSRASQRLNAVNDQINSGLILTADEKNIFQSFSDTDILRRNWWLGGTLLVETPPTMLQVLLAVVAGAFGALLITLVLIVYPNNELRTPSVARPIPRIALGAMIAMCVYIVLLGGTAVLGATTGVGAAGTNYMGFCAISVLAGMYSDRVAGWLSEKADNFFKTQTGKAAPSGAV